MSLIVDVADLRKRVESLARKAERQQMIYFRIISDIVQLHQDYRVAKNYQVSDSLRKILNDAGIEIIQGTAGYAYDAIPPALKGRPIGDTWRLKK